MSEPLSIVHAIRITYGDGATWSATKDELHSTDRARLDEIVRQLRDQDNPYDLEFEVVALAVYTHISSADVQRSLGDVWGISL